ncbi:MAG: D-lyxose/D-mannose family sugar isomerase, partial [Phycisphaerales bacterium]|nr:D-lyxose/D-mannose family sugar isomerase [Phycisphaerales bacterium]
PPTRRDGACLTDNPPSMTTQSLNRARVEASIARAKEVFQSLHVQLPPYAFWRTADWDQAGPEHDEVRDCMLGWDVTDFGSHDFTRIGRTLFTLRNGNLHDRRYPKSYAEKLILDPEGQRAPAHFHRTKREDIINRGGGNILVQLTRVAVDDQPDRGSLAVVVDGCCRMINSGETVRLRPGESLCIPPRTIHQFWGEEGTGQRIDGIGYTVSGEVSSVCDDFKDNFFFANLTRFPRIVEDAPRTIYLCNEYPPAAPVALTAN